jgi:hypothetical protein
LAKVKGWGCDDQVEEANRVRLCQAQLLESLRHASVSANISLPLFSIVGFHRETAAIFAAVSLIPRPDEDFCLALDSEAGNATFGRDDREATAFNDTLDCYRTSSL